MKFAVVFLFIDAALFFALGFEDFDSIQEIVGHLFHVSNGVLQFEDVVALADILLGVHHGALEAIQFVALEAGSLNLSVAAWSIASAAIVLHDSRRP